MLSESKQHQNRLDELLGACLALQKLYGRDVDNSDVIIELFQRMMSKYSGDKVIKSFETWMERSQEFPTPADIIGLIKRGGKPPLSESMFIQISKKDGMDRTPEDWQYLRDYQAFMDDGWEGEPDAAKQSALTEENTRLRAKIKEMELEYERLKHLWIQERDKKTPLASDLTHSDKVQLTAHHMRRAGASEKDISDFLLDNAA